MLIPVPPIFRRRANRERPRRSTEPTPPASLNQILAVVLDGTNLAIVTVGADVADIVNPADAMWVRPAGESFRNPVSWELLDARHVQFVYEDDISACTLWMVGDPPAWQWADSGPTVAPFEGSIG